MKLFKGITLSLMAALLFPILATPASAASVTGAITFSADFVPTGGSGLGDATGIDFLGDDFTVDGATGSFSDEGIGNGSTGVINDFVFAPLPGDGVEPLWSIGDFSFDLTTISIDHQSDGALLLSGAGMIHHTILEDTSGTWTFSGNGTPGSDPIFNFSAGTVAVVPLPAAAWLFGSALFGLVAAARRRQTA